LKITISTIDVRKQLGEILDRVALRYDEFIIERKGKALAAVVPVEKLEQLERAARGHLLSLMARQRVSVSQSEADRIADEAKHKSRRGTP
jgi:prevent-host-death family protein